MTVAVVQHAVFIQEHLSLFSRMSKGHYALCECGWRGPKRASRASALLDVEEHAQVVR